MENSKMNSKNHVFRGRKHTKEEKREQKKRWRKRLRDKKTALKNAKSTVAHFEVNMSAPQAEDPLVNNVLSKPKRTVIERGKIMVNLAVGPTAHSGPVISRNKPASVSLGTKRKQIEITKQDLPKKRQRPSVPLYREINPELLSYSSKEAIGCGSYGECHLAEYRGIQVVVKRIIPRSKDEAGGERRKREFLHEAKVISDLGDHCGLPFLFGITVEKEPFCLILQFHGIDGQSLTLYKAASSKLLTERQLIDIFIQVCCILQHIHSKGYLHNDLKTNNIILEKGAEHYRPLIIDFGKSRKIEELQFQKSLCRGKAAYLAPEVQTGHQSVSSDIYSLGYMLHSTSKQLQRESRSIRNIVKRSTRENPNERLKLDEFKAMLKSSLE